MDVREKLVKLLGSVSCNGNGESLGSCPDRKYGLCREVANLSYCVIQNTANHLVAHGVTVQEWKLISEPPKEKGTYIVCTDNGGVLLGHWYGTAWNAGGGANKHLAYWTEKPQPPKGE